MGSATAIIYIVIVVIGLVVAAKNKSGKKGASGSGSGQTARPNPPKTVAQVNAQQKKTHPMKQRATVIPNQQKTTARPNVEKNMPKPNKAKATAKPNKYHPSAKPNVEQKKEDEFMLEWEARQKSEKEWSSGLIDDEDSIIAQAVQNTVETERDNDMDAIRENLMDPVYDAMAKGPDDTISFQRDFVAEGMDMLNSYQLEEN